MRLPVHCCCEPRKRLGWVDVPCDKPCHVTFLVRRPEVRFFIDMSPIATAYDLLHTVVDDIVIEWPASHLECGHMTLPLRMRRLAVKSADRPLSDWVRVPSFRLTFD